MKTLADLSYDELLARAAAAADLPDLLRVDVSPFTEGGKRWWTKGEGLKKWATKPRPWTALYHHILKWEGMTLAYAARIASSWFHLVFGFWPGEKHIGGVRLPKAAHRSADGADFGMVAVTGNLWLREHANEFLLEPLPELADGDPMGDLDEDTLALLLALAELDVEAEELLTRSFDPNLHKRWPKGHPLAGKFRPMVDLLKMAIAQFNNNGGGKTGHPFAKFSRPQLLNAAKARGIAVNRGEDRDSIAAKLLADLSGTSGGKSAAPAPAGAAAATPTVKVTPGPSWGNGQDVSIVEVNGTKHGIVVHASNGDFVAFSDAGLKTPGGNHPILKGSNSFKTEQAAVDALAGVNTPSKVSGPGLAGLNLTEQPIERQRGPWGPARASFEISHNGQVIGTVHNWGYGWRADTPGGGGPAATMNNKSQAIATLAGIANISPASKAPIPIPPSLPQGSKHGPEIQGALDILYGKDPKGHTIARQLDVYGSLRRHQFDQLGVAEQQTILADLAYIETNSKSGPSAIRASKLIDRFTPPGTKSGTMPTPSAQIVGPANGKQTRLPSPRSGLLKQATNTGVRGDAWIGQGTKGGPVWGQYGAGGLLLRHVDNQGVERFLLTQRGPAISDPGKWSYPGGAFESLEDFYQGATREFAEELGFTDADFAGSTVHGYHVFERPDVTTKAGKSWTYHSVAADVPVQLKPNLSTHGARAETSDARWMTRDEIAKLDKAGKLHGPVAGGKLQANVMSLFSSAGSSAVARPGPVTKRPARLTGTPTVSPPTVKTHKPSLGRNLIADQASRDQLRQDVKNARTRYAGKAADDRLAAIGAMQGFDDVPTVVDKREYDDLKASGDYIEVFRGVKGAGSSWTGPTRGGSVTKVKTAAQVNEEFRSGPAYYGVGIYGNGYYFATDKSIAEGYSDRSKGSVVRALIPKKANIVDHRVIEREAQANSHQYSKAKGGSHEKATLWDEGRYAAAKGHDMIKVPDTHASTSHGHPNYVVLNRSVLIVLEEQ